LYTFYILLNPIIWRFVGEETPVLPSSKVKLATGQAFRLAP
jgi:hypothetical protein